jgi:hypothetical protein
VNNDSAARRYHHPPGDRCSGTPPTRGLIRLAAFLAGILLSSTALPGAQSPGSNAEAMVNCPELLKPEPLTPYGFAKATLVSLWYARNAAQRSADVKKAVRETTNPLSFTTALMRITKLSTNDFICAKRSVRPFDVGQSGENIQTAASFFGTVYNEHINLNQRLIDLLQKMDSISEGERANELSTLQVERGERWADLVQPTTLTLMSLVDAEHSDAGKTNRLFITKVQKKALLDWAREHFPEFKNGTPKAKWEDPAKTAELYFTFLNGHKGSDE